jgi:hypothetical protein
MKKANTLVTVNHTEKENNEMKNANAMATVNNNEKETKAMNHKNNKKTLTLMESRQVAFTYIIYMMVGSYFKKTVCADTEYLNNAELEYNKLTEDEQVFLEEQIIRYTNRQLLKGIASRIWKEAVMVYAKRNTKESQRIEFKGKDFELAFIVDYADGRGAIIRTAFVDHKNKVVTGLIRTVLCNRTQVWYNPSVKEKMENGAAIDEMPVFTEFPLTKDTSEELTNLDKAG